MKEFVAGKYIVMVTKHGVIKKSELTEFDNPLARGIIALAIDEGDELLAARSPVARTIFSSARMRAWRAGSTKRTFVRWAGRLAAFAAWN